MNIKSKKNIEKNGLCIINELETIDDFKRTSNSLGNVYRHRDSLSNGITKIAHTDAKKCRQRVFWLYQWFFRISYGQELLREASHINDAIR
ncbi:hypothetical protein DZS_39500 [Dickeya ananatis]